MSQASNTLDQDTLDLLQYAYLAGCLNFSTSVLPIWEYLITMDREIDLVWKSRHRFSLVSTLLVSTRVNMVLYALLQIVAYVPEGSCAALKTVQILVSILTVIVFVQTAVFSALRTSALYDRDLRLFVGVFVLSLSPIPTNLFALTRYNSTQDGDLCETTLELSGRLSDTLELATRVPLIVVDTLVLGLTWARTYRQIVDSRRLGISIPLSRCLARDGTLYFLCLLVINVLQLATFRMRFGSPVGFFMATLPPVLINRFMLNLRGIGQENHATYSRALDLSRISTLRFQMSERVVGNMGEDLSRDASDVLVDGEEQIEMDDRCIDSENCMHGCDAVGRAY